MREFKTINLNTNALRGIALVLLLPIISYLILKYYSDNAVSIPRRYFADTVINKIVAGKETTDTVWHQVKNITLTNQLGDKVSLDDLKGKVIVADFFFTHCPQICPALTRNMKRLQDAVKLKNDMKMNDTNFVQFVSFTVDPEHDSVPVMKKYADKYGVNHEIWWMLTGPKKTIYDFAFNELKLGVEEELDSSFVHTQKMVVLDKNRVVRGYYDGLDSGEVRQLAQDITLLMLEKDKKKKSAIFSEMRSIWPIFVIVLLAVAVFVFINRKPK